MEALLHVNHLEKNLDEFVLKDVNLTLQPGYIMGLIGVNGTGKTTLIQTILNLYKKDAGDVYVNGYSMEEQEREAKDQIGFVLDKNVFEESLSVWKNAKLFGKLYSRFDEEVFRECCERFQVPLNQKVGKLSTGYQVRFQLAFALSHDAKLFILDEPASGLDPLFRKELMRYMQEIVEDGTRSVLMSTHITEDLDRIGDYILLMKDGRIVWDLQIEEVRERYLIVYGTKEEIEQFRQGKVIYRSFGEYKNYAFIKKDMNIDYGGYRTKQPSLEEVMYCLEKGGYEDV